MKKLYEEDRVILWELKDADDFARLIARRIELYATHPEINAFANSIIPVPPKNLPYSKEFPRIAYLLARDKIKYHREYVGGIRELGSQSHETLISPVAVVRSIKQNKPVFGDCDDKTFFLGTLLANKGYKVRLVLAHILKGEVGENVNIPNHIYLEFAYPDSDKWIPLDPSGNRPFGELSPNVIPLKRFYVGKPEIHEIAKKVDFQKTLPDTLITLGNLMKSVGEDMKKGAPKITLGMKFIEFITNPFTWVLGGITLFLVGVEIYHGIRRKT